MIRDLPTRLLLLVMVVGLIPFSITVFGGLPGWVGLPFALSGFLLLLKGLLAIWDTTALEAWGSVELSGTVTGKRVAEYGYDTTYSYENLISVSGRSFSVSQKLYDSVKEGDDVVVTVRRGPFQRLIAIRHGSSPTAIRVSAWKRPVSARMARKRAQRAEKEAREAAQWGEHVLLSLRALGVDAHIFPLDPSGRWPTGTRIDIGDGSIRWIECHHPGSSIWCFIPDSRIGVDWPRVQVVARESETSRVCWEPTIGGREFSARVGAYLSQDRDATEKVILAGLSIGEDDRDQEQLVVGTEPSRGCWAIVDLEGPHTVEWTKPLWDCYQGIANALLAMPMPSVE